MVWCVPLSAGILWEVRSAVHDASFAAAAWRLLCSYMHALPRMSIPWLKLSLQFTETFDDHKSPKNCTAVHE